MSKLNYSDEKTKQFPLFYKISPALYDSLHTLKERSKNIVFQITNVMYLEDPGAYVNKRIAKEFEKVYAKLEQTTKRLEGKLSCPVEWAIDKPGGELIYTTIRKRKPEIVFETGIANGASSYIILSALKKNKKGRLVSTEVRKNTGQLVEGNRSRWQICIGNPRTIFTKTLDRLNRVDLFIHDSNHAYGTMLFEFTHVLKKMPSDGVIMSDDVSGNKAFIEFARRIKVRPVLFRMRYREFGILYLNQKRKG